MHKIYLISCREYLERVRTKSFLITTILVPLIMLGFTVVPQLMVGRGQGGAKRLTVVASDALTGEAIRHELETSRPIRARATGDSKQKEALPSRGLPDESRFVVTVDANTTEAERAALIDQVKQKQLDGVIWATREAIVAKKVSFITRDVSSFEDNETIRESVADAVQQEMLRGKGLTDAEIKNFQDPVRLKIENATGAPATNVMTTLAVLIFLTTILYVNVLMYGINVMNAVLEEKTSRVMEVMLASTGAKELMAGKIIGVGAVGLTQIGIWMLAGIILSSPGVIAGGAELRNVISLRVAVFFPVFFLLGYALYSTLYAAVGATVNTQQEGQQLQQLIALPLALSFVFIFTVIQYPNSIMAVVASFFPLTSPLMMFARIALQTPPWWQIALSIGLLLATIYGIVLVCAKIYRVGILMYGKKPTLPEIMKWLKYA